MFTSREFYSVKSPKHFVLCFSILSSSLREMGPARWQAVCTQASQRFCPPPRFGTEREAGVFHTSASSHASPRFSGEQSPPLKYSLQALPDKVVTCTSQHPVRPHVTVLMP